MHEGAIPVQPEIAKTKVPVVCVHGADEGADSFCAKLAGVPNVRQLELPGGHHYKGDYDKLGASIFAALPAQRHSRVFSRVRSCPLHSFVLSACSYEQQLPLSLRASG